MLVLHQPLHRQLRMWRIYGLLGRLQMHFYYKHTPCAVFPTCYICYHFAKAVWPYYTRWLFFPSSNIFDIVHLVGFINEYTDINITYTNMSHWFIHVVLIYFFICGSFNNAAGNSGQVTQHRMAGQPWSRNWERRRGQRWRSICIHIPKFGTDKITWKLSQHNLSQDPDQTSRYSKYKAGVLPNRQWNSMHRVSLKSLRRTLNKW